MPIDTLADKGEIERFLRRDAGLHLYELGDLDDFFWPRTRWFGLRDGAGLRAAALLYSGDGLPVLLAMGSGDPVPLAELLAGISGMLPDRVYCHLTPGLDQALAPAFGLAHHGRHRKMLLTGPERLDAAAVAAAERLTPADRDEILAFYRRSYPGNWFDPRMLATGQYFGIRIDGALASVAGVHVHSRYYRVAALGNIATAPDHRGRGLGKAVTAALCRSLRRSADAIGLNVKADNAAAIACYTGLGFSHHAEYDEWTAVRIVPGDGSPSPMPDPHRNTNAD